MVSPLPPNATNDSFQWCIDFVSGAETSAVLDRAIGAEGKALFVAGHGAGSDMNHRSMLKLSEILRGSGFDVVRFNFFYREKGAGPPDRMPKLQVCFSAVVERARREVPGKKLIIGGRSMGGRVASMLAAEGFACDGLLLLAYPLHPPGKPEKLRDAHLPKISVPVLCINGTRDALCQKDLMTKAIDGLGWQMQWLEGKDHSFAVTAEIGELAKRWAEPL
jgi:predicted alpha/beta-hydrolase family hydrolase